MSIEGALKKVNEAGLYVSWMCQGTDDLWHVTLRRKEDLPFVETKARTVYIRRGKAVLMEDALLAAIPPFEDLF